MPPSRRSASISLRGVLVSVLTALGTLHLLVAPGRAHDWSWEGAALATIGVVQIGSGLLLLIGGRRSLISALAVALVPALLLVITRTVGYPFGPFDGYSPSFNSFEFVVLAASVIVASLIGGTLLAGSELLGIPGVRFDTLSALVVFAAAIPGIAVSGWVDDASHFAGEKHVHTTSSMSMTTSLSPVDRAELGRQLIGVREAALSWPTLADALADGWTPIGPVASGVGQMVLRATTDSSAPRIDSPFALLYLAADSDAPIVGVQYTVWEVSDPPADFFTGQASTWHLHPTACMVRTSGTDVVVPIEDPITGSDCRLVDGSPVDRSSFMLRVWAVPGWENPDGVFAHAHPAL